MGDGEPPDIDILGRGDEVVWEVGPEREDLVPGQLLDANPVLDR